MATKTDTSEEQHGHCTECGREMLITFAGISHHLTEDGQVDYDADQAHVAVLDTPVHFPHLEEAAKRPWKPIIIDPPPTDSFPELPKPKTLAGIDLLTGKEIFLEDPKHGVCPRCGKHSVISDQVATNHCLSCNWNDD